MNVLVIDTETTGLPPRNADPSDYHKYDGCRVIQIAWGVYTEVGKLLYEEEYIIKPDTFTIPEDSVRIHGITNEHAQSVGKSEEFVFGKLYDALQNVSVAVAHNMAFDNGAILAELFRLRSDTVDLDIDIDVPEVLNKWLIIPKECTMLMALQPGERWPKLIDLYTKLFKVAPSDILHRADADVRVCARVYFELTKDRPIHYNI